MNYDLENMIRRFRTLQTKGAPQATAEKTKHNRAAGLGRKMQSIIKEQRESMEVLCGILQQELNQLEQYRVRLSLSLAKHGSLLEELDKVAQQHRKAMKLLMEEDLRVEAFMEEGERNQRNLKAAQNQLVCVASAQEAYPIVDAADDSAVVVEDWLQHNKAEFPSGTAYSTSCRVGQQLCMLLGFAVPFSIIIRGSPIILQIQIPILIIDMILTLILEYVCTLKLLILCEY